MVQSGLRLLVPVLLLAAFATSCFITTDSFGGQLCRKNEDCPRIAGYLCASTSTWPQRGCSDKEEGCVCEVLFPPEPGGIGLDGGGPVIPDAGPPPDYCTEIKPILELTCLGTCHGSQMGYPNSPTEFRLDYWEPGTRHQRPDGGPGLPGVKTKIDRIKARMVDERSMPPRDFGIFPTTADIALVNKWVTRFGAPLGDGGCEMGMMMMPTDAGMTDAGTRDGGVDAGAPVSFSTMVLPIFAARCGPCHTTSTSGGLSLTAANAYNALVGVDVSATCVGGVARKRVLANQPTQSQLWLKTRNDAQKCGNSMPNAQMPLNLLAPAQFNTLERWIAQGAPNN